MSASDLCAKKEIKMVPQSDLSEHLKQEKTTPTPLLLLLLHLWSRSSHLWTPKSAFLSYYWTFSITTYLKAASVEYCLFRNAIYRFGRLDFSQHRICSAAYFSISCSHVKKLRDAIRPGVRGPQTVQWVGHLTQYGSLTPVYYFGFSDFTPQLCYKL